MNKRAYLWVTGLGALLIVLGVVLHFGFGKSDKEMKDDLPIIETIDDRTDVVPPSEYAKDWSTLKADRYTLKYPKDFKTSEEKNGTRLTVPVKTYFHTILPDEVYITAYDPTPTCPSSEGDRLEATTTLQIAGELVFNRNEWSGVGAGQLYRGVFYTLVKNGVCYSFETFTHSANGAAFYFSSPKQIKLTDDQHAKDMQAFFELSDKIIGTFNLNQ